MSLYGERSLKKLYFASWQETQGYDGDRSSGRNGGNTLGKGKGV